MGKKEVISSNSSSIIFLAKLDSFYLAINLFNKIFISKEVEKELLDYECPENNLIRKEIGEGFIEVVDSGSLIEVPVHLGEKSAISLCLNKKIGTFMSDDKKARTYARSLGLETVGVIGIILKNLEKGFVKKKKAKDLLNNLVDEGYYMSGELFGKVLGLIEEGIS